MMCVDHDHHWNREAVPACVMPSSSLSGKSGPDASMAAFGPQRGPVMQPKGAEPWRDSLGIRVTPHPYSLSDRNAVPSGGDSWAWGRSGDGTPLGFVNGRESGVVRDSQESLASARHSWAA